jgi:hypothetical protein
LKDEADMDEEENQWKEWQKVVPEINTHFVTVWQWSQGNVHINRKFSHRETWLCVTEINQHLHGSSYLSKALLTSVYGKSMTIKICESVVDVERHIATGFIWLMMVHRGGQVVSEFRSEM